MHVPAESIDSRPTEGAAVSRSTHLGNVGLGRWGLRHGLLLKKLSLSKNSFLNLTASVARFLMRGEN